MIEKVYSPSDINRSETHRDTTRTHTHTHRKSNNKQPEINQWKPGFLSQVFTSSHLSVRPPANPSKVSLDSVEGSRGWWNNNVSNAETMTGCQILWTLFVLKKEREKKKSVAKQRPRGGEHGCHRWLQRLKVCLSARSRTARSGSLLLRSSDLDLHQNSPAARPCTFAAPAALPVCYVDA